MMLQVRALSSGYGASQALFSIDLDLGEGELLALLGRNGMGKTTTIRCLMGLLQPWSGNIVWQGRSLVELSSFRIAQLGFGLVPEGRRIFPNLTVEENLIATARPGAWNLKRAIELFPALGARSKSLGRHLSGGEQQMLAIGRALMTNPQLLILDEATEGLAPLVREEIWRAITALKHEGLSLLVVDKNLDKLLPLADRATILEKGQVAWRGQASDLAQDRELHVKYLGV